MTEETSSRYSPRKVPEVLWIQNTLTKFTNSSDYDFPSTSLPVAYLEGITCHVFFSMAYVD